MKIRATQFAVHDDPQKNLSFIDSEVDAAATDGIRMIVLPEGLIARSPDDDNYAVRSAQQLNGPFVHKLCELSKRGVAIAGTFHIAHEQQVLNMALVFDHGEVIQRYDKLHLYDAFNSKESEHVTAGTSPPSTFAIDDVEVGIITCYDVRFPEIARDLALQGADLVLVPAAWVRGPLKEDHWRSMLIARALENTMYVVGCGEASSRNVGMSVAIDPLGVILARTVNCVDRIDVEIDLEHLQRARTALPLLHNMKYRAPALK